MYFHTYREENSFHTQIKKIRGFFETHGELWDHIFKMPLICQEAKKGGVSYRQLQDFETFGL